MIFNEKSTEAANCVVRGAGLCQELGGMSFGPFVLATDAIGGLAGFVIQVIRGELSGGQEGCRHRVQVAAQVPRCSGGELRRRSELRELRRLERRAAKLSVICTKLQLNTTVERLCESDRAHTVADFFPLGPSGSVHEAGAVSLRCGASSKPFKEKSNGLVKTQVLVAVGALVVAGLGVTAPLQASAVGGTCGSVEEKQDRPLEPDWYRVRASCSKLNADSKARGILDLNGAVDKKTGWFTTLNTSYYSGWTDWDSRNGTKVELAHV